MVGAGSRCPASPGRRARRGPTEVSVRGRSRAAGVGGARDRHERRPFRARERPEARAVARAAVPQRPNLARTAGWLPPGSPSSVDRSDRRRSVSTSTVPAPCRRQLAPAGLDLVPGRRRPSSPPARRPARTSGMDQSSNRPQRCHRARGDHRELAGCRAAPRPAPGPPRRRSSPSRSTTSDRKVVRRSSGSTSVTRRSGRRIASTRPGSPAPGADVAHVGVRRAARRRAARS